MSESGSQSPRAQVDPYLELARARLGRVVRRKWRLDALLGVGGMAAVYAGTHRNGSRAAIKMLHPMIATEEAKRRFLREGYLANSVGNAGVVQVLDDDEAEDGSMFLVMELLEGESLESYALRRIHVSAPDALAVGEQILEVLVAAHAKGIVHRDVKPENVFLCTDGRVKLLDFGVARLHEASRSSSATHHGFLLGTPTYMAPEQARGDWELVDGRTDVWSVGATMFRVLTGRTVHRGGSHIELLLQATADPAPRVRDIQPTVPELVASLVDRALAFDMNERWASAAEMLTSLRSVHKAMGYAASSKLRVKIASDSTVRMELPLPPTRSDEFDRAASLEGPFPDDGPTQVAGIALEREKIRSMLVEVPSDFDGDDDDGDDDLDRDDDDRDDHDRAPPARSGIQGAGFPALKQDAALSSIFDETGESTVAMVHPPMHMEPDGATAEERASTVADMQRVTLPSRPAPPIPARDRGVLGWWLVAGVAVLLFAATLAWRFG